MVTLVYFHNAEVGNLLEGTYLVETTIFVKTHANYGKKSSKFTKKITDVDDMVIHNLIKYLV